MITKFLQNSRCANLFLWTFFFHFSLKFCQCSGAYFDALTPPILPLYVSSRSLPQRIIHFFSNSISHSCMLLYMIPFLLMMMSMKNEKWSATSCALVSTKSTQKLVCHSLRKV
jgi:hypothetical protein